MYLLDVNCLVALVWPNHVHHTRTRGWFVEEGMHDWATSAITQIGFVRVSMNRTVTGTGVGFNEVVAVLLDLLTLGTHTFIATVPPPPQWPEWLKIRLQGYRQVGDAALLSCAQKNNAVLATMDAAILDLTDTEHRSGVLPIPV